MGGWFGLGDDEEKKSRDDDKDDEMKCNFIGAAFPVNPFLLGVPLTNGNVDLFFRIFGVFSGLMLTSATKGMGMDTNFLDGFMDDYLDGIDMYLTVFQYFLPVSFFVILMQCSLQITHPCTYMESIDSIFSESNEYVFVFVSLV